MMNRLLVFALGSLIAGSAHATLMYQVEVIPNSSALLVSIEIPNPGQSVELEMPRWAPGSYRYADYSGNIAGVSAMAGGQKVPVRKSGEHGWRVSANGADRVRVSYAVRTTIGGDIHHFSGPSTYMYLKDRKDEDVFLKLNVPNGWRSTCGLDSAGTDHAFLADDYDVLADNPVTVGDYVSDTYMSNGIKHEIAYYAGPVELVNRQQVIDACKNVSETQAKFWSGLPFKKYVWHFAVMPATGGAGGLEHLSSTRISLAAGVSYSTVSVLSHEYFHAWNVKRIRSKVLGPFDYQTLPKTGALWWLEGVTDYYADLLLYRGNFGTTEHMMDSIVSNVRSVRANNERFNFSPYDSSYRVSEAANGRGNSRGLGVSYYNTGWLVGICLDAELRHQTNGRATLDDISLDLWDMNRDNKPGFEEGDIRRLLVKHGGEALGTAYDNWVMKPGELPVEAQLAKIGLEMVSVDEKVPNIGANWGTTRGGAVTVRRGGTSDQLQSGDRILRIGSVNLDGVPIYKIVGEVERAERLLMTGKPTEIVVERDGQRVTVAVTATVDTRSVQKVRPMANASAKARRLRTQYLMRY